MGATSQHFTEGELRCKGRGCCGRVNECRPELLTALEAFRALAGKPVTVLSAYRCKDHNSAIGGAPLSKHVFGIAADIRIEGMSGAQLEAIAERVPAIRGIGRDDHGNDLHVDVRSIPGIARWCYDAAGRTIPYYKSTQEQGQCPT